MANGKITNDRETKPTRKKILVEYWDEIKPGTLLKLDTYGRSVQDAIVEKCIVNQGGKTYVVNII